MVFIRRLAGARHVSRPCVVNTVPRGWVGDLNERAPFRFHDAVVGFVDRSVEDAESRCFELNTGLSFSQADLGLISGQECFFRFFISSSELFFV